MEIENDRYWIDDNPLEKPFGIKTVGLVDENEGGVVAYFNTTWQAENYLKYLIGE